MAHVHVIDNNKLINCFFGRINLDAVNTQKWEPAVDSCGPQVADMPDYDTRWINGDSTAAASLVVDGC